MYRRLITQMDRQTDRWTDGHMHRLADRHMDIGQMNRQINWLIDRLRTGKLTNGQTNKRILHHSTLYYKNPCPIGENLLLRAFEQIDYYYYSEGAKLRMHQFYQVSIYLWIYYSAYLSIYLPVHWLACLSIHISKIAWNYFGTYVKLFFVCYVRFRKLPNWLSSLFLWKLYIVPSDGFGLFIFLKKNLSLWVVLVFLLLFLHLSYSFF